MVVYCSVFIGFIYYVANDVVASVVYKSVIFHTLRCYFASFVVALQHGGHFVPFTSWHLSTL